MVAGPLPPAMGTPVFGTDNPFTYRELHASVLGAVVGVLTGYAHALGRTSLAIAAAVAFVALALGVAAVGRRSTGLVTVRREPWYALAAFLAGGAATVALLGGGTAMATT